MAKKLLIIFIISAGIPIYRVLPGVAVWAQSDNFPLYQEKTEIEGKTTITNHISAVNFRNYGKNIKKALDDVQDRIDTIDQLGLYYLLDKSSSSRHGQAVATAISPKELLRDPAQYRGRLVEYELILNPAPVRVELTRKDMLTTPVYYAYGHIPIEQKQRVPLILILHEKQLEKLVRRMKLYGWFYMILRQQTSGSKHVPAGTVLDYVVIVAQKLEPLHRRRPLQNRKPPLYRLGLSLPVLVILWLIVRQKNAKKGIH